MNLTCLASDLDASRMIFFVSLASEDVFDVREGTRAPTNQWFAGKVADVSLSSNHQKSTAKFVADSGPLFSSL